MSGRAVPESGTDWLRELIHPPFRIAYRVDVGTIWVVRIWRCERDMSDLAEDIRRDQTDD